MLGLYGLGSLCFKVKRAEAMLLRRGLLISPVPVEELVEREVTAW